MRTAMPSAAALPVARASPAKARISVASLLTSNLPSIAPDKWPILLACRPILDAAGGKPLQLCQWLPSSKWRCLGAGSGAVASFPGDGVGQVQVAAIATAIAVFTASFGFAAARADGGAALEW